ncbi:hypothetical protein [Nonomuraea sp. 10N515B]
MTTRSSVLTWASRNAARAHTFLFRHTRAASGTASAAATYSD